MGWTWTWREVPGWIVGRPCVAWHPQGQLIAYALDLENRLIHYQQGADRWAIWDSFPDVKAYMFPPAWRLAGEMSHAVLQPAGKLSPAYVSVFAPLVDLGPGQVIDAATIAVAASRGYIVVRGTDNAFYMKRGTWNHNQFSWSSYEGVPGGGRFPSPPDITFRDAPTYLEIVSRGMDNRIWHNQYNSTKWDGWAPVGDLRAPFGPAITALDEYTLFLCAPGDDLRPRFSTWKSGIWQPWQAITTAPLVYSDMSVTVCRSGTVAVAYRGANGSMHLGTGSLD